jgi:hypothetical protein
MKLTDSKLLRKKNTDTGLHISSFERVFRKATGRKLDVLSGELYKPLEQIRCTIHCKGY